MKKKKKEEFYDDGRSFADMSVIYSPYNGKEQEEQERKEIDNSVPPFKGENMRGFLGGTMLATLLIFLVYALGIGLVIFIMYLIFRIK